MAKDTVTINLKEKVVVLRYEEFDTDVDVDDLTKVHYENLFGDMVTVSTLLNKVGILKANFENSLSVNKLEFEIYVAGLRKMYRGNAVQNSQKLTLQEVEDMITLDAGYKLRKVQMFNLTKQYQYLDSMYWAVKSKDDKLSVLLKGVTPAEFESGIVEGVINGIFINKVEKVIK